MSFRLLIDIDALEFIDALPPRRRRRVLDHLREIQWYPGNFSDYRERDDTGRMTDVSIFDDVRIHYWIDMADRHIKILRILTNE